MAGKYAEACPKFAASNELDPKGGTLLNLAMCHEKIGRIASAWAEFARARDLSTSEKRPERAEFAEQRIAVLAPMISRVKIDVEIDASDLRVSLDGIAVPRAGWNDPMPVDPGTHEIDAISERGSFARTFVVSDGASTTEVRIDHLDPPPAPPPPPPRTWRTITIASGVLLALGGATLGATFGGLALDKRSEAENLCRMGDCAAGRRANDAGIGYAWGSNISFVVAAAFAVTTIVFAIVTRNPPRPEIRF